MIYVAFAAQPDGSPVFPLVTTEGAPPPGGHVLEFANQVEYAAWLAGHQEAQAAWLAAQPPPPPPLEIHRQAVLAAGYSVQPEDFTLALGDADRAAFGQMLVLVREALDLGMINDATPQTIAAQDGQLHTVSTLRLRQILVGYGFHYKTLWDAARQP